MHRLRRRGVPGALSPHTHAATVWMLRWKFALQKWLRYVIVIFKFCHRGLYNRPPDRVMSGAFESSFFADNGVSGFGYLPHYGELWRAG